MKKTVLGVWTVLLCFGFASVGAAQMWVSLKRVNVDLPKIEVEIHVAAGKDVAGYRLSIAYDPAQLKYVDTTDGDYLPTGGLFLRPAAGADDNYIRGLVYSKKHGLAISEPDDTYALQLTRDDTTTIGPSVVVGEGEAAETFLVSDFLFCDERPIEEVYGLTIHTLLATPGYSHPVYLHVRVFRAAPMASDGDGRLASVAFEVLPDVLSFEALNPDKRIDIHLYGVTLFDADATELDVPPVTDSARVIIRRLLSDVNTDGLVNILDLTGVASAFGAPVSDANRRADVNRDAEINILDLVRVANDLGQAVAGVYNFHDVYADTSVPVWDQEPPKPPLPEPEPIQ